ncbi:MAG: hypothetical protein ABIW38_15675 [Ferruginibacter sp.]
MKRILFLFSLIICLLVATTISAHPGSGIVVDKWGNVYFTDTGKGVWKIDTQCKLTYIPSSRFHWMTIDPVGYFAESQKTFREYFERVTEQSYKHALIICPKFPLVVNKDGNMYYSDYLHSPASIKRRTPEGNESVLASDKIFKFTSGIAAVQDGSIYITEASNANANTIRKITMNGTVSIIATFIGKAAIDLPLENVPSYCRGLAVDEKGFIYVAATGSRSVLKITPQCKISIILQVPCPWTPTSVALFNGEVYVLEWHNVAAADLENHTAHIPRVRKIDSDGKVITLATVSR